MWYIHASVWIKFLIGRMFYTKYRLWHAWRECNTCHWHDRYFHKSFSLGNHDRSPHFIPFWTLDKNRKIKFNQSTAVQRYIESDMDKRLSGYPRFIFLIGIMIFYNCSNEGIIHEHDPFSLHAWKTEPTFSKVHVQRRKHPTILFSY